MRIRVPIPACRRNRRGSRCGLGHTSEFGRRTWPDQLGILRELRNEAISNQPGNSGAFAAKNGENPQGNGASARSDPMQQLLLIKLYDEYTNQSDDDEMGIQDFADAPLSDSDVKDKFEAILKQAAKYYGKYLPKQVPAKTTAGGNTLRSISSLLSPIHIGGAKRDVVQNFYMYFAKGVYKWDLA